MEIMCFGIGDDDVVLAIVGLTLFLLLLGLFLLLPAQLPYHPAVLVVLLLLAAAYLVPRGPRRPRRPWSILSAALSIPTLSPAAAATAVAVAAVLPLPVLVSSFILPVSVAVLVFFLLLLLFVLWKVGST